MTTERERALQHSIVKAINDAPLGAWAVPNVVVKKTRKSYEQVTGLGTGSPDIYVAIAPLGHLWLEVKCRDTEGALSEAQKAWHEKARSFGVTVVTVWSVREAIDAVVKARQDALKLSAYAVGGGIAVAAGSALFRCLNAPPSQAAGQASGRAQACVRAYAHDCQCATCRAKPEHSTRGWEP